MQSVFFKAILIFNDPDVNKAAHKCLRTTLNLCSFQTVQKREPSSTEITC